MFKTKILPFIRVLRSRVPVCMRHDMYLSYSSIFFTMFEDINRDFVLNGGNLETMIEMLISSLSWLLGSHNSSFKWFFQVFCYRCVFVVIFVVYNL